MVKDVAKLKARVLIPIDSLVVIMSGRAAEGNASSANSTREERGNGTI